MNEEHPANRLEGKEIAHRGERVRAQVGHYANGRPAIIFFEAEGAECVAKLTVNLVEVDDSELGADEVVVKTYSENEEIAASALASGLFADTGRRVGDIQAPVWRVVPERGR